MNARILAVLITAPLCVVARGEDTLTLKADSYVKGPAIRLADIATIEGSNADELGAIEILPAARPGASRQVDAALIGSRIREAGFNETELKLEGPRVIRATTLSLEISREALVEDLRRFVELEMKWDPKDAAVDIAGPSYNVIVPDGEVEIVWKKNPQYVYVGGGAFRGEIFVNGVLQKTVMCRVNIDAYGPALVVQEPISRGSVFTPDNVSVEKRSMATLGRDTLVDPKEVMGRVAKKTLFPGTVLTKAVLAPELLVRKRQPVVVEARSGAVVARMQGVAMSDGGEGDIVNVAIAGRKEQMQGYVRKDGAVVVR